MLGTEPERVQNVILKKKKDRNSDNVFSTRSGRYKNWAWKMRGRPSTESSKRPESKEKGEEKNKNPSPHPKQRRRWGRGKIHRLEEK